MLPRTMKAVVLKAPRDMELMEIPVPELTEPEHVLIAVKACGICGSDLRYWAGENPWALHTLGRHIPTPPNLVLGHEFAGVVVAVNDTKYEPLLGQRVGVQAFRTCGTCALCRSGHENLCKATQHIGHAQGWGAMPFYPGGYAEYCLGWADLLHPMADHVTFEEETTRDFMGVAVHAVGRALPPVRPMTFAPGSAVLCIGGGPVGLSVAQVAHARGAEQVFISEPSPIAQDVIRRYDVFALIDPTQTALGDAVAPASCTAIFDTVGTAAILNEALPLLTEAGTYVNIAVHDVTMTLNAMDLGSERAITTSANALYRDEREAHELIAESLDVSKMITHRFPLEAYEEAYALLLADPKKAYKVVFDRF